MSNKTDKGGLEMSMKHNASCGEQCQLELDLEAEDMDRAPAPPKRPREVAKEAPEVVQRSNRPQAVETQEGLTSSGPSRGPRREL